MRLRTPAALLTATALALGGILLVGAPAHAADQVVTNENDSGAGSLRAAVAAVSSGDTITFAPGVEQILLESEIVFPVGVTIDGPADGNLTIARGDIGAFSLFNLAPNGVDQDFFFEGFTLDGRVYPGATPSGANSPLVYAGSSNVRDITFQFVFASSNTASRGAFLTAFNTSGDILIEDAQYGLLTAGAGGAISIEGGGDVTIRRAMMTINSATGGHGGAVEVQDIGGALLVEDTEFVNNFTDWAGGEGSGGALYAEGVATVEITSSFFTDNSIQQDGSGGALYAADIATSIDITDSEFNSNQTSTTIANVSGGAVAIEDSPNAATTVTGSLFEQNESLHGGAISLFLSGSTTITDTTFFGNSAAETGGALFIGLTDEPITITGSSFSDNDAGADGGAFYLLGRGAVQIATTEFVENDSDAAGGALYLQLESVSSLVVAGSQFRDNTAVSEASAIVLDESTNARTVLIDSSTIMTETGGALPLVDLADVDLNGEIEIVSSTFDAGIGATGPVITVDEIGDVFWISHSTVAGDIGVQIAESNSGDIGIGHSAFETVGVPFDFFVDPSSDELRLGVSWSAFTGTLDPVVADDIVGNQTSLPSLGLSALAENGGPAYLSGIALLTRLPDPGSPVIDAGQNPPGGVPDFDERGTGFARVIGAGIDIGAIEAPLPVADGGTTLPATGATISWWLFAVAGGVLALGAVALVIAGRIRRRGAGS